MKLICFAALAIFSAIPCFAEPNMNVYLLENSLDANLPNSFARLLDKTSGCRVVVKAHSDHGLVALEAIQEICSDGMARRASGRAVLRYGARGVIESGTDVPMTIKY